MTRSTRDFKILKKRNKPHVELTRSLVEKIIQLEALEDKLDGTLVKQSALNNGFRTSDSSSVQMRGRT